MSVDYKATVFLPKTEFPMKAGLSQREPELLARWAKLDLYRRQRQQAKGREPFVLHDGPPYANGHLHIGHALNKILKDFITRTQQMLGRDSNYVPGWDCHGLPIEWKIEEEYRKKGKNKDEVDPILFRQECRAFAEKWLDIQREEFKRLGLIGDWDNPYSTMSFAAEAQIVRELGKFVINGGLFKGAKPVLWSVVEKTALAEAEVEYHDHTSTMIWIRFPVVRSSLAELTEVRHGVAKPASVVIWTTTPWTMPGNRAIAYGADIDYVLIEVVETLDGSLARIGERMVVAKALLDEVKTNARIAKVNEVRHLKGHDLLGTICHHPWHGKGYDFQVPLLAGDFVTIEQGTGFVHTAPGHGEDDFYLCQAHGIAVPETVMDDGTYYPHVPLFAGQHVFKAAEPVLKAMTEAEALLATGKLVHSYPHSWRSKAPLIFRTTPQWFISMKTNDLRAKALAAIDATRFVPEGGRKRLYGMIESRPDWCVSRQRAWGVPITVFVSKQTGEPLRDAEVLERIAQAVAAEGADAWFASPASRFLGAKYDPADYDKVTDILDVWFDSGCTHSFVLEGRDDLKWPASLYLEGSDQHRGWFHSSLLESCGTRGRAPYDAVLTHGFVMAEDGHKMSKSLGNIVSPQDVVNQHGADILRLWVASSDYFEDLRIGPEILKQLADIYRRLRNTLRYLLGNLDGFGEAESLPVDQMPELERWVLHRLWEMDGQMRQSCHDMVFHGIFGELHNFCAVDLSAFYFDVRKDSLYCDHPSDVRRRACRTVLNAIYECLTAWLAPFLCFTAEEAWLARHPGTDESVHLRLFPTLPAAWRDDVLAAKWAKVRDLRRVVTGALEVERAAKRIGSSLQGAPEVFASDAFVTAMQGVDLAEIAITSKAVLRSGEPPKDAFTLPDVPNVGVRVAPAEGKKCARCWKVLPEVGQVPGHPEACPRCADAAGRLLA